MENRPEWIYTGELVDPITEQVQLIRPLDRQELAFNDVLLRWEEVENAENYLLELSKASSLNPRRDEVLEWVVQDTDTVISISEIDQYYWRVTPLSKIGQIGFESDIQSFEVTRILLRDDEQDAALFSIEDEQERRFRSDGTASELLFGVPRFTIHNSTSGELIQEILHDQTLETTLSNLSAGHYIVRDMMTGKVEQYVRVE